MDKKKTLFDLLGTDLRPLTAKEKKALIKEAKAKEESARAEYIQGGHRGYMGGWWTGS